MCAETDEEARESGWMDIFHHLQYNSSHTYEPGTVDLWGEYQDWKNTESPKAFDSGLIGSTGYN